MKFSVLLPTRNGGRFLKDCIGSILEEPYENMELIISDNANTDETQEIIKSFSADQRLKVIRLVKVVNVIENWNYVFRASSGDYFLMMGDDDCLLPGYFRRMEEVLKKYNNPDCVTYNAYTYVAPDSINGNKQSYYNKIHFKFGDDFKREGLIPPEMRFSIVKDMFRFRVRIPLNMQTTLVSGKAARLIAGGIFQPPFPDHYALNALLLNTKSWVYVPENMLIVGVSSKSFGHFVYSNQQDKGLKYLGIGGDFQGRLPGNELINYMHIWLNFLKNNYQDKLKGVQVSRSNYVRRQIYYWYMQYKLKVLSLRSLRERLIDLSAQDWIGFLEFITDKESWLRLLRVIKSHKNSNIQKVFYGTSALDNVSNIKEFKNWVVKTYIKK